MEGIKNSLTGAADAVGGKLKDSLSFVKEMKEAGWEKVTQLVNDILGLAPLIQVTGFNMKELSVDAGIPPGITVTFLKEKEVDAQSIEKMLNENRDKEILNLIVLGLQKADALQKQMNLPDYLFRGLSMKIGLPPDISLKFSR